MDNIDPALKAHFDYIISTIGSDDPYCGETTVGIFEVLKAHYLLADYFLSIPKSEGMGGIGPRDNTLLHSTLSRQFTSYEGHSKWKRPIELCATLFYGLIKNHPFHDANKRTALLVLLYHINKIGLTINAPQRDFESFTVNVASNNLEIYPKYVSLRNNKKENDPEIYTIVWFLSRNTRAIDNKNYTITYRELDTILKRRGFGLENLRDNHVDVVRYETRRRFGFFGEAKKYLETTVCQIGMPSWKAQVGSGAIKTVRKATKLDAENDVDSAAFFHGVEPFNALISTFEGPLKRLADK